MSHADHFHIKQNLCNINQITLFNSVTLGPRKLHIKVTGKMGKAIIKNQNLLLVKSGNAIINTIKVFC